MRRAWLFPALGALIVMPLPAAAQGECDLERSQRMVARDAGTPYEMVYLGGPVLSCPGGMRITADSAVYSASVGEVQFLGRVRFRDGERRLDADYAQYLTRMRHLAAAGNVVLVDEATGSTIRSPTLDYMMEGPQRPEARIEVYSGRPRTLLVSRGDGAQDVAQPDTTIIDSDALSIIGEHTFIGRGNAVMQRGDLTGRGRELHLDQQTGSLQLDGTASMETAEYRLQGQSIRANVEADTLREVTATGEATLEAEDIDVAAPHIVIDFEAGLVHRLRAIRYGPPLPQTGVLAFVPAQPTEPPQPSVRSPQFNMVADSIDVVAPDQKLERLFAVGTAFGERLPTDSLEIAAADTLPAIIARDWVSGDTIIATFVAAPEAGDPDAVLDVTRAAEQPPTDASATAREDRVLESLTVFGSASSPARSAYRTRDANDESTDGFTINYLLAREIRVAFEDGEVKRVEAEGEIQGIYLRPTAQAEADTPRRGTVRR